MKDEGKTKRQLISELVKLRQFIGEHFNIPKDSIDDDDYHSLQEASQHLKKSQEKFMKSFLQNSIPMGLTTQKEGRFVEVSEAFLKLMGFKRDEVIGNTSTELGLITAEQRSIVFNEFKKKGLVDNLELQVRPKNGKLIHGLFNAVLMSLGKEKYLLTVMTDISERKRLEEELKRSEQKYRKLAADYKTTVDNASDGIYRSILEGRYIMANRAFASMLGYDSPEDLLSSITNIDKQIYIDSKHRMDSIHRVLEAGHGDFEIHFKRKDGSVGWISNSVRVVRDKQGEIKYFEGLTKDITERKLAEKKSKDMLNFLQTLFNTIPSPIFCKDINGLYQDFNKEFEVYAGRTREEILGKGVYEMYPKDVADKYNEMDLALFRQPGRQVYEHPIIYADGSKHDVIVNKATYFNADGTVAGLVGVMVDITERKQAEFKREAALKELRESEAKLRLLFNSGKDYVAVHLMGKDGQPMNFVQVNDDACEKLGYTREELLNSSPQDIDAAYSSGRMPELIEKLHENKQVLFETEMLSKNGHRIPMEVSVNLFQLDDNQATMCVARDITDRKQVEQELANRLMFQQTLIDTIPHPIFFKDTAGRFVGCNRAYEREFGITRDYMIGKTVLDLEYLPIDERQRFQDEDMMVIREAGRQSYEMPIVYADGQTHITLYSVDGFTLADGNPGGLIGMLVDISERKKAEDELANYREGLELLVAERTQELENKTNTLEEVNIAMKVLLQHREEDKKDLEDRFVMNVKNLIMPYAEKLKRTPLDERQLAYLGIMETNLEDITSSLIKKMHQFNFTPTEIEVASLIKEGKSTKEITSVMGIATSSINTHRNNIRKKLGISLEKVNLRSHLQSFN